MICYYPSALPGIPVVWVSCLAMRGPRRRGPRRDHRRDLETLPALPIPLWKMLKRALEFACLALPLLTRSAGAPEDFVPPVS